MLVPLENIEERLGDTLKVVLPNMGILAVVNIMTVKCWLEVALVSLSIAYTLWRWRRDISRKI